MQPNSLGTVINPIEYLTCQILRTSPSVTTDTAAQLKILVKEKSLALMTIDLWLQVGCLVNFVLLREKMGK